MTAIAEYQIQVLIYVPNYAESISLVDFERYDRL